MAVLATNADGYVVDDDYDRLDKKKLFELVSAQFWASYVTLEQCAMRFRNSWAFGLYSPGGEMVGCMRLVTDRDSFFYASDVIIDEPVRGQGLGSFMVTTVFGLPEVEKCNGFLYTGSPQRCAYYSRLGGFYTIAGVNGHHGTRFCMERLSTRDRSPQDASNFRRAAVANRAVVLLCGFLAGAAVGAMAARRRV